ncbi:metallophosphoesterase [Roseomonas sp. 18066]|uniref:metallophosphoesterase n=1 Tax=Roseomonas sp. 18066 TaxID=2681412 RepID=UPI001357DF43|nr:metallophosphoesterase [Roseomonas sp. 18066]
MLRLDPAPAALPPGERLYAIGDIHGCAARLAALHARIAEDVRDRPVARSTLLHLGDYIDKGEDSAGVLSFLADRPAPDGMEAVFLTGNHEAALLAALAGGAGDVADWLWCGGRATLASYGLDPDAGPGGWAAALPPVHLAFLRGLRRTHRAGGYFFTHAGIRPGVALEDQREDDLIRIRQPFLSSEARHGAVVVHGHTARAEPEIRHNRINLDTAAWSGGPLSCGVFEGDRIGFLFG